MPIDLKYDDDGDTSVDSVHAIRMKEFLILNNQATTLQRPKCSISPINDTTEELLTSSSLIQSSPAISIKQSASSAFQSPSSFLMPSHVPAQSTPNKYLIQKRNGILNKTNFHSICDLAKSASSSSSASSLSFNTTTSDSCSISYSNSNSFCDNKENQPIIPNTIDYFSNSNVSKFF